MHMATDIGYDFPHVVARQVTIGEMTVQFMNRIRLAVTFPAKGLAIIWAEQVEWPVIDTEHDTKLLPPSALPMATHAPLLRDMHYRISISAKAKVQSEFSFAMSVTRGHVVARWAMESGDPAAKPFLRDLCCPEETTPVNVTYPGGANALASDLDTLMATIDPVHWHHGERDRHILAIEGRAYVWAACMALNNLEVGLCSHQSKDPTTLEADLRKVQVELETKGKGPLTPTEKEGQ